MALAPVLSKEDWEKMKAKTQFKEIVPKSEGSDWQGLVFKPKNVHFSTQNKDEVVYILLRRHVISNVGWIFNLSIYAVLPLIIYFLISLFGLNLLDLLGLKFLTVVALAFYSTLLTSFVRNIADWYFNMYIVTNERVIDYDFKAFVSKGAAESALEGIQDVRENSVGFLPSLFNYGDVSMYSAADKNVIIFDDIPNPTLVRDKVADLSKIAKDQTYA